MCVFKKFLPIFCQLSKTTAMPPFFLAWLCFQSCIIAKETTMVQSLQHLLPVSTKKKKKRPTPGVDHGLWLAPHHVLICTLVLWLPPGGQSLKSKSIKKLCLLSLLLKLSISDPTFSSRTPPSIDLFQPLFSPLPSLL